MKTYHSAAYPIAKTMGLRGEFSVKTKPEETSQVFPRFTADQSFPANTIQHALRPGLVLSYSHARLV